MKTSRVGSASMASLILALVMSLILAVSSNPNRVIGSGVALALVKSVTRKLEVAGMKTSATDTASNGSLSQSTRSASPMSVAGRQSAVSASSSGCSGVSFVQPAGSPVGAGTDPQAAAVGDFNLDGKPDFAVVNATSSNVTIQLGNGAGGFNEPAESPIGVGAFPLSVAVGDFNLDGKPDLAVANNSANSVTILLGNGSGGFNQAAGSPIPTGTFPVFIALSDLNLDGKPDLAVANQDGNLTILLGNGSGGFTQPPGSPFLAGSDSVCVAIGDFNLDGRPDVAISNLVSANVTILLGNGSGGFTQPAGSPIFVELFPNFVAAGDFNTDGKPDLAVANLLSDSVTILLGNGNGGFAEAAGSPVIAGHPDSIAVGDFNLDGKSDLAVTNTIVHNVTILLGDGSGGFTQPTGSPIGAGEIPLYAAIGDFNLDGKPDLAIANQNTNNVTIQLNACDAFPCSGIGFMEPAGSPVGVGMGPRPVVSGDFNLDGKPDLATANEISGDVTILLGNGGGGFTQPAGSPVGAGFTPISLAVGDLNLDGKPDLAVANNSSDNVTILLGNGSGGFTQPAGSPVGAGDDPLFVVATDFNLDGKPDLAVANFNSNNVTILVGDGNGGFTQAAGSPVAVGNQPGFIAVGDFNLDGKPDLAVTNANVFESLPHNVTILLGNGSGGFTQPAGSPVGVGSNPESVAAVDFNQDGKPDLAVANFSDFSVTILLGNGNGGFIEPPGSPVAVGAQPEFLASGDFNLDGKPDLAVASENPSSVAILVGNGNGGFTQPAGSPIAAGAGAPAVAVGDFNRDRKPDLAVANLNSNNVMIQLNICTANTTCAIVCPANITMSNTRNQCGAVVTYNAPTPIGADCGPITCSPASGSFFAVGTTTVTCTSQAGASCSFTVKVNDTQPPQITCPANITSVTNQAVCAPASQACQVVTFAAPVASDNCPGVIVVCNPPSGSCIPVGTTTVTCTATDASMNTATCSFAIKVFDVCLQNDGNPATLLLFNSATGEYRFCCGGIVFTGIGTVSVKGCTITLQHNPGDRRLQASVDKAGFKGSASFQFPPGVSKCTITDRDIRNNSCACE